jgi:hypothetical protein
MRYFLNRAKLITSAFRTTSPSKTLEAKENRGGAGELTVYIPTCDANIFAVKYFQYFFNKYWDQNIKVKILGFSAPDFQLEKNFEFISLGREQVNNAKGWSNYLIPYFKELKCDYFIFGIDDFMIARPVDLEVVEAAKSLMNKSIGRIDLQPLQYARNKKLFSPYAEVSGIKFFKMAQKQRFGKNLYRNAGAFSIWNREWFLKNIRPDWSPWDWEVLGSKMSENDGFEVIGSYDRFAIKKSELLSNQWPGIINTLGLRENDIEIMRRMVSPEDRIKLFQSFGSDKFGYAEFAGENWVEVLYGK